MAKSLRKAKVWGVAVGLVLIAAAVATWLVFDLKVFKVSTGSMEPTLPVGTLVLVMPDEDISVGDVITFYEDGGEITTHTFIGYAEDGTLMTKGDANLTPDRFSDPLEQSDVIGRVVTHTSVFTFGFWMTPRGIIVATILAALAIYMVNSRQETDEEDEPSEETRTPSPV